LSPIQYFEILEALCNNKKDGIVYP